MVTNKNGKNALVPAVDRAAQILATLADSKTPLGVSELSRRLRLNKSTVHDILATLSHHHLLARDDSTKTYRLGSKLADLARHTETRRDLRALARPHLIALAQQVEETVFLGAYRDGCVIIADKEEAPHDFKITSPLGRRLNYAAGAFGKIFLAAMSEIDAHKLMRAKSLPAFTRNTITKTSALREELRQTRAVEYAIDDEEYLVGVRAAAAPVNDARGRVIGALCVVGMKSRLPMDKLIRIAKETRRAARDLSRELGAVEYPAWKGIADGR